MPIVLLAFAAGVLMIERQTGAGSHPLSFLAPGQILIGLVATTVAIKEFGKADPSLSLAVVAAIIGATFIALFVRGQRRATIPMLDLRVFSNPDFSSAVIASLVAAAALMGLSLATTQRFQLVLGMSPLEAGIHLLPLPVAAFVAGPASGRLIGLIGNRRLLPSGMGLMALGLGLYFIAIHSLPAQIIALLLIGAGVGVTIATASAAILNNAPKESAGTAASVEEVSYELGGALGVTIFGSILTAVYTRTYVGPASVSDVGSSAQGIDQALQFAEAVDGDASSRLIEAAGNAFDASFAAVLIVALVLVICGAILVRKMSARGEI